MQIVHILRNSKVLGKFLVKSENGDQAISVIGDVIMEEEKAGEPIFGGFYGLTLTATPVEFENISKSGIAFCML